MSKYSETQFVEAVAKQLDDYAAVIDNDALCQLDTARKNALAKRQQELEAQAQLLNKVRDKLVESEKLPITVEIELNKIRTRALSQASKPRLSLDSLATSISKLFFGQGIKFSHSMVAAACLTVAVVSVFYSIDNFGPMTNSDADLAIIASSEELELYENLDFYLWLADNELLN